MFEFRQEPFKSLYFAFFAASTILVRLPYWILMALPPFARPRRSWSFGRSLIVPAIRAYVATWFATGFPSPPGGEPEVIANSADAVVLGFVWVPPLPSKLVSEEIRGLMEAQGVVTERTYGYWYQREGIEKPKNRRADPNEKVILYFHGGGYISGSPHPQGGTVGPITSGLFKHCCSVTRVFAGGIRISSSAPFATKNAWPAALLDALACYWFLIHILDFSPSNVIICGDSSGGHLALALTSYTAKQELAEHLPIPGALLLLSPVVEWGLTHVGKDSSMARNRRSDYCEQFFKGYTQRSLLGSLPASYAFTSPWISPGSLQLPESVLDDLFVSFPPRIYVLVGGAEVCLDSYRTLRNRLFRHVGEENVKYNEVLDATHDLVAMTWHEPERTEALKDIGKWVDDS